MGTPPGGGMGATGSPQGLHAPAATRPVTSISGMTLGTTSPSMESGPSGAVPGMTMPPGTGMSGSMSGGPLGGSEPVKRKRGRPRKYTGTDAEGNIIPQRGEVEVDLQVQARSSSWQPLVCTWL
jgi:hypothetical protein